MTDFRLKLKNNLVPLLVFLFLASVHFFYLNKYGINIPFSDDYNEILRNVNLMQDSSSFNDSIEQILYGTGYSKPIALRLFSLLHLSIGHEINFKYLVFTGNIFLILTCLVFIIAAAKINKYLAITVSCLVFQPQYWEAIYQATLSNAVFPCLFFSLTSIYCVTQQKTYYYAASLICAVLAQISFGNGFLVYPILLLISIYNRNFRFFTITIIIMILSTYLYMRGTTVSYTTISAMDPLTRLKLQSLWLPGFLGSSAGYVFGSGYDQNLTAKIASVIIGYVLMLFYLFVTIKKYFAKNLLLFSFFTFFILTALLATQLRFSVEAPGASRYQIQSVLCILTALIIFIDLYAARMNRAIVVMLTVALPLFFVFTSYKANTPTLSWHKSRLATGLWAWSVYGRGLTIWDGGASASLILTQSINRNIYYMPSRQSLMADSVVIE